MKNKFKRKYNGFISGKNGTLIREKSPSELKKIEKEEWKQIKKLSGPVKQIYKKVDK